MTRSAVFAPVELIDGDRGKGIVLLADHARRDLPEEYGDLGLPPTEFDRHIAYDIGVEGSFGGSPRGLARRPCSPRFSRLLIDPNRGEDDPTLITPALRRHDRAGELSDHRTRSASGGSTAITGLIMTRCRRSIASVAHESGAPPLIFSIHSFTPQCGDGSGRGTSACFGTSTTGWQGR